LENPGTFCGFANPLLPQRQSTRAFWFSHRSRLYSIYGKKNLWDIVVINHLFWCKIQGDSSSSSIYLLWFSTVNRKKTT